MRAPFTVTVVAACLVALGTAGAQAAPPGAAPLGGAPAACAGAVPSAPTSARSAGSPALAPGGMYARALRQHATWLTTMTCQRTGIRHAAAPAGRVSNNLLSTNWSGYQVTRAAHYAQAGWSVPTVRRPVPGYSSIGYYSSTWAGIGGGFNAGNGALIQAGTTQDVSSTGAATYYAWYEVVGGTGDTGGEIRISNLPIRPGDVVGGVGLWSPPAGGQAGVCNFSLNTCISFAVPSSAPGTTAEWIVEAPSGSTGILPLADFRSVTFVNSCWALVFVQGATCSSIAAGGPQPISLEQFIFGSYQTVAVPRALTPDGLGFTDDYLQPTRPDPCPTC